MNHMMMSTSRNRIGFFERISRGWKMARLGMAVVRADPELMVYTFLSAVFSLVAIGAALAGSIGLEAINPNSDCVGEGCEGGEEGG